MSLTEIQPNQETIDEQIAEIPDNETLHRLSVEAGKYLDLNTGEPLPKNEIIAQGKENGYTESEMRDLLTQEGYSSVESIPVPPQGSVLGELWCFSKTTLNTPEKKSDSVGEERDGTLCRFREWCEERAKSDKVHSYTRRKANRRYAKAKDVDRRFVRRYDEFTTVLITYCKPTRVNESISEHAERFYPRQVTRKRRRILKQEGVYEGYAGISVLSPKVLDKGSSSNAPTTHAHDFLWLPSGIADKAFEPLLEIDDFDIHISVKNNKSSKIKTPESVNAIGSGIDKHRGDTTQLPQELGANLPLLTCKFDARGTPDYVEKWCAHLRKGTDSSFSSQGVRRFTKLGVFNSYAEREKVRRKVQNAHIESKYLSSLLDLF